ncbi:MAG: molybdate ABC transporter substrate-binding protein [Candidatus Polarisedimenticolaceae bacterium]|nr:molybdate ABC transporter substrate-binding protein [Candidatus Polarisedimenticolaceae bacterium]
MIRPLLFTALILAAVAPALADTVHVATASNFSQPLRLLAQAFEEKTQYRVRISTASTGKLYAQIKHGAPYHLFLSADQRRPEKLVQEGLAIPDSRFTYAVGRLVLWAPQQLFPGEAKALISQPGLRRFSIANPKTAPYGAAARQTLKAMGLWKPLQGRLVRGENIAQTFQFVASRAAEMGLVAYSQLSEETKSTGYHWVVPQALYDPVRQDAVLLKRGTDNPAAKAFLTFLQSERARALIRALGYGLDSR